MTRTGKIARLPKLIRDELNRRLERNLPGSQIVAWLNALPETREVLASLFDGRPVSEQNLSQWRSGGFLEWQTRSDLVADLRESSHDTAELEAAAPLMADKAARILTARLLVAARHWNGDPDDPAFRQLQRLSALLRSLSSVRRSEHNAAKLHMEQHAFDLARQTCESLPHAEAAPVSSIHQTASNQIKPPSAEGDRGNSFRPVNPGSSPKEPLRDSPAPSHSSSTAAPVPSAHQPASNHFSPSCV